MGTGTVWIQTPIRLRVFGRSILLIALSSSGFSIESRR